MNRGQIRIPISHYNPGGSMNHRLRPAPPRSKPPWNQQQQTANYRLIRDCVLLPLIRVDSSTSARSWFARARRNQLFELELAAGSAVVTCWCRCRYRNGC